MLCFGSRAIIFLPNEKKLKQKLVRDVLGDGKVGFGVDHPRSQVVGKEEIGERVGLH
jgi:hypothetical protein